MWFNSFSATRGATEGDLVENDRAVVDKGRQYVFTPALEAAIDVAIGLGRPLLVSGEPGCGKTELGYAVARRMQIGRVHFFSTKSNSEARDLFYAYDAIARFRDAQVGLGKEGSDAADYIEFQALGRAILDAHGQGDVKHLLRGRRAYSHPGGPARSVVIIDEIDKASRDFPNDLLREIEDLSFRVPEMGRQGGAEPVTPSELRPELRPVIIVTSNEERQLPDAFLRRCVFHEIEFPSDPELLGRIIDSGLRKRFPPGGGDFLLPLAEQELLTTLVTSFRAMPIDKRPGISELIDAATLLAYPGQDKPHESWIQRLEATLPALAKLKNDRLALADLIRAQAG